MNKIVILLIGLSILVVGCSSQNTTETSNSASTKEGNIQSDELKAEALREQSYTAVVNEDYIQAKKLLEESLKYNKNPDVEKELQEIEIGVKGMQNAKEYASYIEVNDVEINKYDSSNDVFVKGTIKNNGDKAITFGLIKIYYLDESGNKIGEEFSVIQPVTVAGQIKPNYIGDFTFMVSDGIKDNWSEKYELAIHLLEFDDDYLQ